MRRKRSSALDHPNICAVHEIAEQDGRSARGIAGAVSRLETSRGFILITGCSHSTVEEIVAGTKQVTGANVDLVEGGFHLIGYKPDYIASVAKKLKDDLGVHRVAPTHCTGETAMAIFREQYGANYVRAELGSVIRF